MTDVADWMKVRETVCGLPLLYRSSFAKEFGCCLKNLKGGQVVGI